MQSLLQHSLEILLTNQAPSGAYVACPSFPTYQYAWFRDGAYCAHALTRAGQRESAARFHTWASATLLRHAPKIQACLDDVAAGRELAPERCLHSRFTLDGAEVPGHWGHHQPDGVGAWLWALNEYQRTASAPLPPTWRAAAELAVRYLSAVWPRPSSDCWEENETRQHTYTLAAVYGGLTSAAELLSDPAAAHRAAAVRTAIQRNCIVNGRYIKSSGLPQVDANLIGLYTPFQAVAWEDPVFQATLAAIRAELATPLGLHRYAADRYYGGGEWLLLTAWLGWAYARAGQPGECAPLLAWIEAQAAPNGDLPEQVAHGLCAPDAYPQWVSQWGPIASPLLWSHAQYILLLDALHPLS